MNCTLDAKIQREIRRRAFERVDALRHERQIQARTQYTLDALQEVTGLHRPELESIADAVKHSLRGTRDEFFSLKRQILITSGLFSFALILTGLMTII
jgi:hypothetical protein